MSTLWNRIFRNFYRETLYMADMASVDLDLSS